MDVGDDQTRDREERMDWEAGVERGSETTGSKTASNQTQVGSGATTERGNEIVWGHGQPATRDKRRRQQTFELGICPPPDSSDCHARSLQPHWVEATRPAIFHRTAVYPTTTWDCAISSVSHGSPVEREAKSGERPTLSKQRGPTWRPYLTRSQTPGSDPRSR